MKYLKTILKAAAVVSLLAGIAGPEPRLFPIVLSAVLMTAGIFAGGSVRAGLSPAEEDARPFFKTPVVIARVCLGALAAVFIFYGILHGGAGEVLRKAVRICMECIGLG